MTDKTTWWNSSARNLVYARWGVLVLINALFPLFLAVGFLNNAQQFIGISLAIASFMVIYAEVDLWLIDKRYFALSKQLRTSAAIKIGTVVLPFIDMIIGMLSMAVTRMLTGFDLEKVTRHSKHYELDGVQSVDLSILLKSSLTYLTTMIDGVLLTLLVGLILLVLRLVKKRWGRQRTHKSPTKRSKYS